MSSVKKKIITILTILIIAIQGLVPVTYAMAADIVGSGIVSDELNVREGPGKEYDAIGKVYKGDEVNVLAVEDGWLKIEYHNTEAYVSGQYVTYTIDADEEEEIIEEEPETEEEVAASAEEELKNETQDEKTLDYYLVFGGIAAIVILAIFILVTIRSIKKMDEEDDYDEYDDDAEYDDDEYEDDDEYDDDEYEDDDEDEDEEEDDYERYLRRNQRPQAASRPAQKQQAPTSRPAQRQQAPVSRPVQRPKTETVTYEDDEYEYEYVVVRKPKKEAPSVPQSKPKSVDDYTLDIDPSYFE